MRARKRSSERMQTALSSRMAIWKKEPSPKVGMIAMLEGEALVVDVSWLGRRETWELVDGPRPMRVRYVFVAESS